MWQIYQNSKPTVWKETYETEKTGQIQRNGKTSKWRETKDAEKTRHGRTNAQV